jgi:hypothetical protein
MRNIFIFLGGLALLLLAACGPATQPPTGGTVAPLEPSLIVTPFTATLPPTSQETATGAPQITLPAATTSPFPAATETLAGTETTGETSTPTAQLQYVRLTDLLAMAVRTQDQQQIAQVRGVMVQSPDPAAGLDTKEPPDFAEPLISYVLVNAGETVNATPEAETPQAEGTAVGGDVLVPWTAFRVNGAASATEPGSLTFLFDESALTGAPRFSGTEMVQNPGWDADLANYWQGSGIPVTGQNPGGLGKTILIRDTLGKLSIFDSSDLQLGQVVDFLVDARTGKIIFALLSGGETFGERTFVVPTSLLQWQTAAGSARGTDLGRLITNFTAETFANAPFFSQLDPSDPDWLQQVLDFWQQIQPTQ